VRHSELDRTLRLAGLAVVLGCGMYTAFNATQAIFLTRVGARAYPLFFVVLALTVWPAIAANQAIGRRYGVARALRYNLFANALIPVPIFAAYSIAETPVVAFAAYVIYSVAFEVVMLAFWGFVAQYFNILEAKRILPVIAAGSGLGYILAGATTAIGARSPLHAEGLCLLWSLGAAGAGLIAHRAERRLFRPAVDDDADELAAEHAAVQRKRGMVDAIADALRYLRRSRLVLALVLLATVLVVAMRISDYVAAVIFVQSTRDLTELTVLIGSAWEISYVIQLALGLWITPWLLARAGVRNAILTLPVLSLLGFALVALFPALLAALVLFVVRNGVETGVDDPVQNVVAGALPDQVGPKLKVLLDSLVLPGAAAVAGTGLLLVQFVFQSNSAVFLALVGAVVTLAFVGAALWVRSLYLSAIYQRLRSHTLSLSDLEHALGKPRKSEIDELTELIASESPELREFAATALSRLAPPAFGALAPRLAASADAVLRRLAYRAAPPGAIERSLIEDAMSDRDPWAAAAAVVAATRLRPPSMHAHESLERLFRAEAAEARAAAVWAAAGTENDALIVASMGDAHPRVRLEAISSFSRLRGRVPGVAEALIACLEDDDAEVRRAAVRQAIRWRPPAAHRDAFAEALLRSLSAHDPLVRRSAGEALAIHCPDTLGRTFPLLGAGTEAAVAAVETLVRSGHEGLVERALGHVEDVLATGTAAAQLSRGVTAMYRRRGGEDHRLTVLRIALEDHARHAVEVTLAALRALHDKRGFARVARGLRSEHAQARSEAVETLLNFGPARLVEPLVKLLDVESLEPAATHDLEKSDLDTLAGHPDPWVRRAAAAVASGGETMKELIALKQVPLFADLTLEQLASIDRLMVTRHYLPGETLFRWGDTSSELYVVVAGEVRIHRDQNEREVTLARLSASTVLGEMAPFTEQPRSATAEATVATTCRVLRKDRLEAILYEHPEVLLAVIRNLSQRLALANQQLEAAAGAGNGQRRAARRRQPAATG
jgi:CRP-like cAMP-binding protein